MFGQCRKCSGGRHCTARNTGSSHHCSFSCTGDVIKMLWLLWLPVTLAAPRIFPLVDPGLFVISGVSTCGEGGGYCLLGLDCTLDEDFLPDLGAGQHCEGLRSAFTPSAHFVCCRAAANRSTSKPQLLLSSDPTTEKLTTLSLLENEIDQVVLKVAQSVDSVKTVTTQKSEEKEVEDSGGEMMADSPGTEEENEESSEEGEIEESEEDMSSPSSSESDSQSQVTESSSSEEESSEESSIHNTESSENLIQQYHESVILIDKGESGLKLNVKPGSKENMTSDLSQSEEVSEKYDDKSSNVITSNENSLESNSLKDAVLQNEIINEMIAKDSMEDLTETGTSGPAHTSDQVTPKTQSNNNPETMPKPSTSGNISKDNIISNTSSTTESMNEVTPTTNMSDQLNNTQNIINEQNKTASTDANKDPSTSNTPSSIDSTEDRLGTTTTVTPGSDNGPMGEVTQGQPKPCSTNCSEQVVFEYQNQPLCFGSLFTVDWVVTSASCALRIFRVGMVNVNASLANSSKRGVKTIVVHESYGESAGPSGQDIEANNIGLVRVTPGPDDYCTSCLPDAGQLPRANCSTVSSSSSSTQANDCSTTGGCEARATNANAGSGQDCKGPPRVFRDDHGFSYISLACDTPWPRSVMLQDIMPVKPWGKGSPLFCDGVLAGVEASVGTGTVVYTPLSHYLDWLDHNTHPGLPEQYFNLG